MEQKAIEQRLSDNLRNLILTANHYNHVGGTRPPPFETRTPPVYRRNWDPSYGFLSPQPRNRNTAKLLEGYHHQPPVNSQQQLRQPSSHAQSGRQLLAHRQHSSDSHNNNNNNPNANSNVGLEHMFRSANRTNFNNNNKNSFDAEDGSQVEDGLSAIQSRSRGAARGGEAAMAGDAKSLAGHKGPARGMVASGGSSATSPSRIPVYNGFLNQRNNNNNNPRSAVAPAPKKSGNNNQRPAEEANKESDSRATTENFYQTIVSPAKPRQGGAAAASRSTARKTTETEDNDTLRRHQGSGKKSAGSGSRSSSIISINEEDPSEEGRQSLSSDWVADQPGGAGSNSGSRQRGSVNRGLHGGGGGTGLSSSWWFNRHYQQQVPAASQAWKQQRPSPLMASSAINNNNNNNNDDGSQPTGREEAELEIDNVEMVYDYQHPAPAANKSGAGRSSAIGHGRLLNNNWESTATLIYQEGELRSNGGQSIYEQRCSSADYQSIGSPQSDRLAYRDGQSVKLVDHYYHDRFEGTAAAKYLKHRQEVTASPSSLSADYQSIGSPMSDKGWAGGSRRRHLTALSRRLSGGSSHHSVSAGSNSCQSSPLLDPRYAEYRNNGGLARHNRSQAAINSNVNNNNNGQHPLGELQAAGHRAGFRSSGTEAGAFGKSSLTTETIYSMKSNGNNCRMTDYQQQAKSDLKSSLLPASSDLASYGASLVRGPMLPTARTAAGIYQGAATDEVDDSGRSMRPMSGSRVSSPAPVYERQLVTGNPVNMAVYNRFAPRVESPLRTQLVALRNGKPSSSILNRRSCDLSQTDNIYSEPTRPGLTKRSATQLEMTVQRNNNQQSRQVETNGLEPVGQPYPRADSRIVGSPILGGNISLTLRKGLLWSQRKKLFARWKEKYFILTTDYLQCFKKGTSRISEMGAFLYKIRLCDIETVGLEDRRGYFIINLHLQGEDVILLRQSEGIKDWYSVISQAANKSRERRTDMLNSRQFWDRKQFTDTETMQIWQQNRTKLDPSTSPRLMASPTNSLSTTATNTTADTTTSSQQQQQQFSAETASLTDRYTGSMASPLLGPHQRGSGKAAAVTAGSPSGGFRPRAGEPLGRLPGSLVPKMGSAAGGYLTALTSGGPGGKQSLYNYHHHHLQLETDSGVDSLLTSLSDSSSNYSHRIHSPPPTQAMAYPFNSQQKTHQ